MGMHKFINPYNFIPLEKSPKKVKVKENEKKYTGYMKCFLTLKTPLIMIDYDPDKIRIERIKDKNGNEEEHKIYSNFFSINKEPVIPASELRGMIRNKFELLTNSCLSSCNQELELFGRHLGNIKQPGLLEITEDSVKLYKSIKYVVSDTNNYDELLKHKTGDFVHFKTKYIKKKNGKSKLVFDCLCDKGNQSGYVKIGEEFNEKRAVHIFVKDEELTNIKNQDDLKEMYEKVGQNYSENLKKDHRSRTNETLKPVWYENVNGSIYLSLGQNGQIVNKNTLDYFIPKNYQPCNDINNLCETCEVFGTINEDDQNIAVLSKVRFTDGIGFNYTFDDLIVLDELAEPNYKNPYFYMQLKENGNLVKSETKWVWNADYRSNNTKSIMLNEGDLLIRGRKQYWHHPPIKKDNIEKTERNKTVKPMKEGKFKFKVYFNDLPESQLEHLYMTLCLDNNSNYCHKLGLGKPLGYGSVKITVEEIKQRCIEYNNGKIVYSYKPYNSKTSFDDMFNDLESLDAIKNMLDFDFIKESDIVDYPRNQENGKIYEWFESNKKSKEKKVLPFVDEEYDHLILEGYK